MTGDGGFAVEAENRKVFMPKLYLLVSHIAPRISQVLTARTLPWAIVGDGLTMFSHISGKF